MLLVTQVCRLPRNFGLYGRLLCQISAVHIAGVKLLLTTCLYLLGYLISNPERDVNVTKYFYNLRQHLTWLFVTQVLLKECPDKRRNQLDVELSLWEEIMSTVIKSGFGTLLLPLKFKAKENDMVNQGVTGPPFSSRQGQLCDQTSLLRALSSWVFKTCKDVDGTIFLVPCNTLSSRGNSFSHNWYENHSSQLTNNWNACLCMKVSLVSSCFCFPCWIVMEGEPLCSSHMKMVLLDLVCLDIGERSCGRQLLHAEERSPSTLLRRRNIRRNDASSANFFFFMKCVVS